MANSKLEKILISGCFLGLNVRYNGQEKALHHASINLWLRQKRLITVCPEVAGGLSVPRAPAEIQKSGQIIDNLGVDVTKQFSTGAEHALALCQAHQIKYALLKESSPSCGRHMIYDGSFSNKKISGQGLTCQLLLKAGVQVFSEQNIDQLEQLIKGEDQALAM